MSTLCIAIGPFGRAIADELDHIGEITDLYELPRLTPDVLRTLPIADDYIVATCGRFPRQLVEPSPSVCRWRTGFLPIVYDHPHVVIGPRSGLGGGTCRHCGTPRRLQYSQATAFGGGPGRVAGRDIGNPVGVLPPTATIAAHAAASLLSQRSPLSGDYIVLGALTAIVERGRSIGIPGCPTCLADHDRTERAPHDVPVRTAEWPCGRTARTGRAAQARAARSTMVGAAPGSPRTRSTGAR